MPRLEFRQVGAYTVITSPDVPGLCVADMDRDKAIAMVEPTAEALNRMAERRAARESAKESVRQVA